MINLLPPKYKEEIKQEENLKIILILGILAIFFLFFLSSVLFLMKIYISNQIKTDEAVEALNIQQFKQEINAVNQNLSKLNLFYQNQTIFTSFIKEISETLPPDIHLTGLSFTPVKERGFQVSLSGFALHRETLFQFKKNLQEQENFEEIYVPMDSWVKPADINFSLSFKIK